MADETKRGRGYAGGGAGYGGGGFGRSGYGGGMRGDLERHASGPVRGERDRPESLGGNGYAGDRRDAGPHRGRGPKGYRRSDERILEDLHERLTDDSHIDARNIEITVEDGEVTLAGTVASRWEKRHAEILAEEVSGVGHVQNNLRAMENTSFGKEDMSGPRSQDRAAGGGNPVTGRSRRPYQTEPGTGRWVFPARRAGRRPPTRRNAMADDRHRSRHQGFDRDQSRYGGYGRDDERGGSEIDRLDLRGVSRDRDRGDDDGAIARRGFGNRSAGYDDRHDRQDVRGDYGYDRPRASGEDYGEDRYRGDTSGGYGTGGSAMDYRDVMGGGGGYGARDYERGYRDLDPDRVFSRFDRSGDEARPGAHRGRGPRNYRRSDDRIREDVSDRLMDDSHVDASEIEVTASGGEVTLSGSVSSRAEKRYAEDIAEAVSGVAHVQNNLRVIDPRSAEAGMHGGAQAGSGGGLDVSRLTSASTGAGAGDTTGSGVNLGTKRSRGRGGA